jgi:hypothetical protein
MVGKSIGVGTGVEGGAVSVGWLVGDSTGRAAPGVAVGPGSVTDSRLAESGPASSSTAEGEGK